MFAIKLEKGLYGKQHGEQAEFIYSTVSHFGGGETGDRVSGVKETEREKREVRQKETEIERK